MSNGGSTRRVVKSSPMCVHVYVTVSWVADIPISGHHQKNTTAQKKMNEAND